MYDETTGEVQRYPQRTGQPQPRPSYSPPPCDTCPKVPTDAPVPSRFNRVELGPEGDAAYEWHLRNKACGRVPQDEAQERVAVACMLAEQDAARADRAQDLAMMADLVVAALKGSTGHA